MSTANTTPAVAPDAHDDPDAGHDFHEAHD